MAHSTSIFSNPDAARSRDSHVWSDLKQAIATSSGFKGWQIERNSRENLQNLNLDQQVRIYLRETLETLAY